MPQTSRGQSHNSLQVSAVARLSIIKDEMPLAGCSRGHLNSIVTRREYLMLDLDRQFDYWNRMGPGKSFGHPVNFDRLKQWLSQDSRILDLGCGYGRALGLLFDSGYHNLIGFDPAPAMVAMARERFPAITFDELNSPPHLPLDEASVDATLLFAVLTCVPTDLGQRALAEEVGRVLRPGGLFYISDLWLQTDERNRERYIRDEQKYGTYGMFDLPEGVTVRHHDPRWIAALTRDFDALALDDVSVQTMNGHPANGFQWFGLKRTDLKNAAEPASSSLS